MLVVLRILDFHQVASKFYRVHTNLLTPTPKPPSTLMKSIAALFMVTAPALINAACFDAPSNWVDAGGDNCETSVQFASRRTTAHAAYQST